MIGSTPPSPCRPRLAFGVVPGPVGLIRGEHGELGQVDATCQAAAAVDEGNVHLLRWVDEI